MVHFLFTPTEPAPTTEEPATPTEEPTTPTEEPATPTEGPALTTEEPTPTSALFFEFKGQRFPPGSEILITDVGTANHRGAGSSVVCVTSNVNTKCCRRRDGGNVGEWHFPNGTMVPRNRRYNRRGDFTRTGFTHQVRLNRRNNAMGPVGAYTCRVPDPEDSTVVHSATITLGEPRD